MVLPIIKEVKNLINFLKTGFTKGSFRYITIYINGLISLAKKTVNKISKASNEIKHQQALNRVLTEAKFERELLEKRYLKKIKHLFRNSEVYLIFDDTLVKREGKKIEETQSHFDHNSNDYMKGHQFFTAIIYTPFLQMPLFPELYSKSTDSKIEMAQSLIDKLEEGSVKVDTILFDSWYSDAKLINKALSINSRVICGVKTNRNIKFKCTRKWRSLSFITERINPTGHQEYKINDGDYRVASFEVRLTNIKLVKLLVSHQWSEKEEKWNKIHLISTNPNDNPEEILRAYRIRWCIETYHRDIKQNLGFAEVHLRKREGIVCHSILVAIAYAILKLFMYRKGINQTIGECCESLKDKTTKNLVKDIVVIDDKPSRMERFEEVFISESRKV